MAGAGFQGNAFSLKMGICTERVREDCVLGLPHSLVNSQVKTCPRLLSGMTSSLEVTLW